MTAAPKIETPMIPRSWVEAENLNLPMLMIYEGTNRFGRDLIEGERRIGGYILPPFQRPSVWTEAQQVRFIESLWAGLPVGAYVFNSHPRHQEVAPDGWLLDGQQRITAIVNYTSDAFPVHGHLFSQLTTPWKNRFSMMPFSAYRMRTENIAQCEEVYDRLAYGGTAHEPK